MADKGNARRPAGQDLEASSPDRIRNVVLVGPGGSGKTTLVETLLATAGAVTRTGSVDDGTTVSDHDPGEQRHGRSHALAVAPLVHEGIKINLIDTPGYADFVGELRAGLRAADCALFVIAANEGVDDRRATRSLWRECAQVGMPRAVVDHQARPGPGRLRRRARPGAGGVRRQGHAALRPGPRRGRRGHRPRSACSSPAAPSLEALRGALIEGVIEESEDETLMDRYLGGEEIDAKVLVDDLERAVARATFFPVVPVCSVTGVGCAELLDLARARIPLARRAPLARGLHAAGRRGGRHHLRPRRRRWSRRSSARPATPTSAGSAWSGSSAAR